MTIQEQHWITFKRFGFSDKIKKKIEFEKSHTRIYVFISSIRLCCGTHVFLLLIQSEKGTGIAVIQSEKSKGHCRRSEFKCENFEKGA